MSNRKHDSVMLLHGIRTDAAWQIEFDDALSRAAFEHDTHRYQPFGLWQFASAKRRREKIEEFYKWYCERRELKLAGSKRRKVFRPHVVAHSFGTYIVGHALKMFEDITFGKVLLCGSILDCDFDWVGVFGKNQVLEVRNDFGCQDWICCLARFLVKDAGPSGALGFNIRPRSFMIVDLTILGTATTSRPGHYKQWLDFLLEESPTVEFRTIRSSAIRDSTTWEKFTSPDACDRSFGLRR